LIESTKDLVSDYEYAFEEPKKSIDEIFTFGKYKGKSIKEVYLLDESYISWCKLNTNVKIDFEEIREYKLSINQWQDINNGKYNKSRYPYEEDYEDENFFW